MNDYLIWIVIGTGVMFIAIKLLVVHLYRRLVSLDETAPDQEKD